MPIGLFLVRGDNIVLLGELDANKEASQALQKVSPEILTELLAGSENVTKEWDFEE